MESVINPLYTLLNLASVAMTTPNNNKTITPYILKVVPFLVHSAFGTNNNNVLTVKCIHGSKPDDEYR